MVLLHQSIADRSRVGVVPHLGHVIFVGHVLRHAHQGCFGGSLVIGTVGSVDGTPLCQRDDGIHLHSSWFVGRRSRHRAVAAGTGKRPHGYYLLEIKDHDGRILQV